MFSFDFSTISNFDGLSYFFKNCPEKVASFPPHLLALFCYALHQFDAWIRLLRLISEHVMSCEVIQMPIMQLRYVSDAVKFSPRFQKISIFWKIAGVYNASFVGFCLEVRVREVYKDLWHARSREVVAEILHWICSNHTDVIVGIGVKNSISPDFLCHIVHNFFPNL